MSKEVEIYHLFHSGAAVVTDDCLFIFDYYRDNPVGNERSLTTGVVSASDFSGKAGYVFASHSHGDHYQPVIYSWQEQHPDIKYILSSDISGKKGDNFYYVGKDEQITVDDISVQTYGSTDRGVSFLVTVGDLNIFHAGDLNWWHWQSFSQEELREEERAYKEEINKLKGKKINIAFVPVDPRLGEYYYLAGEYFIEQLTPDIFVPLHFSSNFEITDKFADKMGDCDVDIVRISSRGQKVIYKK